VSAPVLRSAQFRREREAAWRDLDRLVTRVEAEGTRALTPAELSRLPLLYRATLSALSVARATTLDRNVVEYLEALAARAYVAVYATRRRFVDAVVDFFARRFPRAVRDLRAAVLLSAGAMLLGAVVGFAWVGADPDRYYAVVGDDMAGGRDPAASTETLREALYDDGNAADRLAAFAAFLFTHNAQVGILAFALGAAAGLPTFLLLFTNGLVLGAFAWLYASRGLSGELWAWLLPHAVPELSAVVLCGAGGFVVAHALVFPGRATRLENLARRGRDAGVLVLGAVALLLVAGLVEGVFRQAVHSVPVRYALAAVLAGALALWLVRAGRRT
jgi:uncharacterized membrane protein SpoIIM required for sporulation